MRSITPLLGTAALQLALMFAGRAVGEPIPVINDMAPREAARIGRRDQGYCCLPGCIWCYESDDCQCSNNGVATICCAAGILFNTNNDASENHNRSGEEADMMQEEVGLSSETD